MGDMHDLQPWQVMWIEAFVIFLACKVITLVDAGPPPSLRACGYFVAWPGLDAYSFMRREDPDPPQGREWAFAAAKTLLGAVVFFGAARAIPGGHPYLVGWAGMVGIVLMLHFGLFHLLSCGWRANGVEAEPLMKWPIAATGLGDFWGKRWNTAFRDLTHRFLFRPLIRRFGAKNVGLAVFASFTFSGLVHDTVISLPAGGGYGGPTIFFILQAIGLRVEWRLRKSRSLKRLAWPGLRSGVSATPGTTPVPPAIRPERRRPLHEGHGSAMNATIIHACGLAQFGILIASSLVPFRLDWKKELGCLSKLHRQMYWVYGGYVVLNIIAFGLISVFNAAEIASGTPLGRSFCVYVSVFWAFVSYCSPSSMSKST